MKDLFKYMHHRKNIRYNILQMNMIVFEELQQYIISIFCLCSFQSLGMHFNIDFLLVDYTLTGTGFIGKYGS